MKKETYTSMKYVCLQARHELEPGVMVDFFISPIDAHWVKRHPWWANNQGYIYRQTRRKTAYGESKQHKVYLHREILGLQYGDNAQGDHKNRCRQDNRRSNLRRATPDANKARVNNTIPPVHISEVRDVMLEVFA